ncbi:hypothetical protein PDIG_76150 [Penicillium digitatum PHI26]|uniref:Uncharacterized protein n=2 Tax=Penicillium digitatum TaxID=36651 RepID=K9FW70_PEND2|nr:hypothetical protein PDIP_46620 [Penicillium digitatum Pd1]EKV06948.1 hypothetical protein PDIG_76150 [Penicillium digitatum PHI26]EKV13878.1 hypothetical protein PDIP_46620 [Penicillium digitatum Pd1]
MDKLLSVKPNNPITVHDKRHRDNLAHNFVVLPSMMATSEIDREKFGSGSSLIASAQNITNDLSGWLRPVPDRLRIDFTTLHTHM